MLIGILSDSHGKHLMVRKALALFDTLGASFIIHCGDVGGPHVFDELVGRDCRFVWGNTDEPDGRLTAYLKGVGLQIPVEVPTRFELDGRRFALFHGHEREFDCDLTTLRADYVLHGHTHRVRDERFGQTRVINPGALCRANPLTVATLDPESDVLQFHEIAKGA